VSRVVVDRPSGGAREARASDQPPPLGTVLPGGDNRGGPGAQSMKRIALIAWTGGRSAPVPIAETRFSNSDTTDSPDYEWQKTGANPPAHTAL
jgi:hypothetical protein